MLVTFTTCGGAPDFDTVLELFDEDIRIEYSDDTDMCGTQSTIEYQALPVRQVVH